MTSSQRKYIAKLYSEMYDPLLSYALSVLPSPSQAEEAVQDTFQIACQKADEVCSSPNPKGWLTNTLKNVIGNELKQRMRDRKIIVDSLGAYIYTIGSHEDNVDVDILYGNVADTPEFKLIKAIALDGKSLLEISKELGISLDAVKKRAQRARKVLQKRIK